MIVQPDNSDGTGRPLEGASVCFVSVAAFGGVWRTYKQAITLAEAGARVFVVGYGHLLPAAFHSGPFIVRDVAGPQDYFTTSRNPVRFLRVMANILYHNPHNRVRAWSHRDNHALVRAVRETRADVVQAVDLPALSCAHRAARSMKDARFIYASHEFWPGFVGNPDMALDSKVAARLLDIERTLIHEAQLVTVVSDAMGRRLAEEYGIPTPLTLLNAPQARVDRARPVNRPVRLVFHGGLSTDRNIEGLVRAMGLLGDRATLDIHGFARTQDPASLRELIDSSGLGDRVTLHGAYDYPSVVELIADYDVGVMANKIVDPNFEIALPNKVFDCMCAGLAVAMGDSPAIRDILAEVPFGIALDADSPISIAAGLAALLDDTDRIMRMKEAAVEAAPRYWWSEQGRKLVAAFEGMLRPE